MWAATGYKVQSVQRTVCAQTRFATNVAFVDLGSANAFPADIAVKQDKPTQDNDSQLAAKGFTNEDVKFSGRRNMLNQEQYVDDRGCDSQHPKGNAVRLGFAL